MEREEVTMREVLLADMYEKEIEILKKENRELRKMLREMLEDIRIAVNEDFPDDEKLTDIRRILGDES